MINYTVILGTFNEEKRVELILKNFHGRANIVIFDNYSTDGTLEIARKYTDNIIQVGNKGWLAPEDVKFRFDHVKTDYVLIAYCGQFHPFPLIELYDKISSEKVYQGIAVYQQVYSYGRPCNAYGRPLKNKNGAMMFFNKKMIDVLAGSIHDPFPLVGSHSSIYFPPKCGDFCVSTFRDDGCNRSEMKHTRYAEIDAAERYAQGERSGIIKIWIEFIKHLVGCLIWKGAMWQGAEGVINSIWRAYYFMSVQIRIWEFQKGYTQSNIHKIHADIRERFLSRGK